MPEFKSTDPLHGVTLEKMMLELVEFYGWEELARRVNVRVFQSGPGVPASLKFLRKTPWAREKIEQLYRDLVRRQER